MNMQAIIQTGYGPADVLQLGTLARPVPKDDEVLVRVHAAALDRGTWHMMTGRPYLMRVMGFGFSAPNNPVPGLDLAGTVVAVGDLVTRFRTGDPVFGIGRGSLAEYTCAREDKLVHKPASLSFEQAAALRGSLKMSSCRGSAAETSRSSRAPAHHGMTMPPRVRANLARSSALALRTSF
jgi:NADPH:quinone reductase-like Zn-dependent oxidoreductase